jgi:hypothetical protein
MVLVDLLIALLLIGLVYWVCSLFLPHPIPIVVAVILLILFVLVPLLEHGHRYAF